ncbi:MAG: RNA methyltransferase [Calditrichaeota bacterium]|nr:RNA methyltransferase [Calditrichota bacterium]
MNAEQLSKAALKRYRALKTSKGRREAGLFLAEGVRLCEEAFEAHAPVRELLCTEEVTQNPRGQALLAKADSAGVRIRCVDARSFAQVADTQHSQGVVAVVEMPGWPERPRWASGLTLGVDNVRDPGNLGTVWRSAAWFGVERLLLSRGCVDPHNPKVVRASMGGLFYVPAGVGIDLEEQVAAVQAHGGSVLVAAADGEQEDWPADVREPILLVVGGEAEGVSEAVQKQADHRVRIRRWGAGESLNVAVATSILLANWRRWRDRD